MAEGMTRLRREYRAALATFGRALHDPGLRKVVVAFGFASATEAATWLAIGVYAFDRSGATGVGLVGLAILLPSAVAAPIAASLADRHRRKRILVASYLSQTVAIAATAAALWFDAPSALVYGLATLASLALTPIRPAQGALLPSLSGAPADLTAANVALTSVRNLGLLMGPLTAGLLLRLSGPAAVFTAFSLIAACATWLIQRVHGDPPRATADVDAFRHLLDGARLLVREERAALVVGVTFAKHVVMGAIRAFLVIVALGLLQMGPGGPGILSAALGVGGALGGGTAVLLVGRRRLTPALMLGAGLLGVPVAVIGLWPGVAIALIALVVAGIGRSLIDVAGRTLLGRVSPEEALARFLGMLEGSSYAGLAVGSATSALLVGWVGIRGALVIAGMFLPVLVLAIVKPLAAIDRGPLVSRDRLELILQVPMFEPLPPESVERLASHLTPIVMDTGTTLIRQGDVGDRFYVLETGRPRHSWTVWRWRATREATVSVRSPCSTTFPGPRPCGPPAPHACWPWIGRSSCRRSPTSPPA